MKEEQILYLMAIYENDVKKVVDLFEAKFGKIPNSLKQGVPKSGYLSENNETVYKIHGAGCEVQIGKDKIINFDWEQVLLDKERNHIYIDPTRILQIISLNKKLIPLEITNISLAETKHLLASLCNKGKISYSKELKYYFIDKN